MAHNPEFPPYYNRILEPNRDSDAPKIIKHGHHLESLTMDEFGWTQMYRVEHSVLNELCESQKIYGRTWIGRPTEPSQGYR